MTEHEFCIALQDMLECEETLTMETDLAALEEYDSLFIMSVIAYIDRTFKVKCDSAQLKNATTPAALVELIGKSYFTE